jgi:hypothetical protein
MFLLKPSRWRNRFLTEPANINATAGNGASCPLPSVAAMSACWTGGPWRRGLLFVPQSGRSSALLDNLVGAGEQCW